MFIGGGVQNAQSLFLFLIFFVIMNAMIQHIIFDFGGVFLDLGGKHTGVPVQLAKIFNISEEQASVIWKANKIDLLTGKETPKEFLSKVNNILGASIDSDHAHEQWKALNKMEKSQIDW